ncbi:MAG TPA: hypothetical protein VMV59_05685 [Candidatus Dormibacteraeota bacterium]|nr:hypothetical protein [Candidatus Dormibacteraeota bacterium]
MAYTTLQKLRKMRATNKGSNRRLAASLRRLAGRLERKGPEELTRQEVNALQTLRSKLAERLRANALTQAVQDNLDVSPKGKHER